MDITYETIYKVFELLGFEIVEEEKETPKKFKIKIDKDGRVIWVCPKCGRILMKFWSEVETIRPFNYCDECGQRLDWNDETLIELEGE